MNTEDAAIRARAYAKSETDQVFVPMTSLNGPEQREFFELTIARAYATGVIVGLGVAKGIIGALIS